MKYSQVCGVEIHDELEICSKCRKETENENQICDKCAQGPENEEVVETIKSAPIKEKGIAFGYFLGLIGAFVCLFLGDDSCRKAAWLTLVIKKVSLVVLIICILIILLAFYTLVCLFESLYYLLNLVYTNNSF